MGKQWSCVLNNSFNLKKLVVFDCSELVLVYDGLDAMKHTHTHTKNTKQRCD